MFIKLMKATAKSFASGIIADLAQQKPSNAAPVSAKKDEARRAYHRKGYWVDGSGEVTHVSELDTLHLLNIMLMLKRKAGVTVHQYVACANCRTQHSGRDGLCLHCGGHIEVFTESNEAEVMSKFEIWPHLTREYDRR